MRLKENLPPTAFKPLRGLGKESVPVTGEQSLPSSRFWSNAELLANRNAHYQPGDIFLGRVDETMIGLRDNRHIMTIAGSRSGKSACLLIPNLLLYPGSVMVIDPKGELAEATAAHRAAMEHEVRVLDPFGIVKGSAAEYRAGHNPLHELAMPPDDVGTDRLIDDAALVAEALMPDSGRDEHWTTAARNLVTALILMLVDENRLDMTELRRSLLQDSEGLAKLFTRMSSFEMAALKLGKDPKSIEFAAACIIARTGAFMLGRDPRERSSVIATAIEQLAFLDSPAMASLFEHHHGSIGALKRPSSETPVTIYLVLPAGYIGTHFRWLRLMIALALSFFERSTAKPDHPVLLILEEFAALGHLRPVEQAAGFIAGAHVRLWSVLQDLPQLKRHYKDGWETFIGNAGIIQAFSVSDHMTCNFLSKRMGETTLRVETAQHVNSESARLGDTGIRYEYRTVPLMPPAEIAMTFRRQSIAGEAAGGLSLVLLPGTAPFVVDRVFHGELRP